MKKLKKISLELNKEVVSNLSNDNLNQIKGGATEVNSNGAPCCFQPISVPNYDTCMCLYTENTCKTQLNNPCMYPSEAYTCDPATKVLSECVCISN